MNNIKPTEKLFYTDAYIKSFEATVISCNKTLTGYSVILDKTAFFPNEGGQPADSGFIAQARVINVTQTDNIIQHETDSPLCEGSVVMCSLDFQKRFTYMQTHSGEHILTGIIHKNFGLENVGFHINTDTLGCTVDYNGVLSSEQLAFIEQEANEAVYKNIAIKQLFPGKEELNEYNYRSKLELKDNVRLISIEGIDLCACCAPHVSFTGEIGLIKVLSAVSHRGGTRIVIACGRQAIEDYINKYNSIAAISSLLSVKQNEASAAVEKLTEDYSSIKKELSESKTATGLALSDSIEQVNGNLCFISNEAPVESLRVIVNRFLLRCNGFCCAFSGNDETGYSYVIGSNTCNLCHYVKEINTALFGKGGGKPGMIQGSVKASAKTINEYFSSFKGDC